MLSAAEPHGAGLKQALGAWDLTLLGVGAIVGAGIFATIGTAAAGNAVRPGAGPSLLLSFVITAVVCSFTAFCYAELASTVPVSGSAYTYAYATLGELAAWIIGWDLILEYAISNVAVAISWANYFRVLMAGFGIHVPLWLATDIRTAHSIPGLLESAPHILGIPIVFNALAMFIVALLTALVVYGIRESSRANAVIVIIKIAVLMIFVAAAGVYASPKQIVDNWQPFFPNGWTGTLTGAAIVFFAYVGFDSVSTVAEETRDPGKSIPRGILGSLVICTLLYLVVTAVFTGLIPYGTLTAQIASDQAEPLTLALRQVAPHARWLEVTIAMGAVIAQTAAILVYQIAQPRIFFVMARDGLLPPLFASVHPRYKTPHVTTLFTGVFVGLVSAVASIDEMVDLTNIGTLFAFVVVCVGVPLLRMSDPDRPRPFKVPGGAWLVPGLGTFSCLFLMWFLPPASWWRFVGWLVLGLSLYLGYGYARSALGKQQGRSGRTSVPMKVACGALLLVAGGMFALPHDVGFVSLYNIVAGNTPVESRERILSGAIAIGVGLVAVALASLKGLRDGAALRSAPSSN